MKLFLIILSSLSFIFSCNNQGVKINNDQMEKQLIGNWIPKIIEWDVYDPGQSEELKVRKEKNTHIINFSETSGKIISTTLSLNDDDSLTVQVDIKCDNIEWKYTGNKDFEITGIKSKGDKLIVSQNSDTLIKVLFNDVEYIRTNKIEHTSIKEIEKCN